MITEIQNLLHTGQLLSWGKGLVEQFPYIGLFALLLLGAVGFPFPEDATLILCGVLISNGIVTPIYALAVVYPGLLTGDIIIYCVGRKYGEKVVTHKRFRRIVTPERLAYLETMFQKRGALFIVFGRHFVGLRAQIFLVAGVMKMSAPVFILADAFSSIFTISLMVGAGYMGGSTLQKVRAGVLHIEHIAVLLLVVLLAGYLVHKYLLYRKGMIK